MFLFSGPDGSPTQKQVVQASFIYTHGDFAPNQSVSQMENKIGLWGTIL
jgi:hypothetical protein